MKKRLLSVVIPNRGNLANIKNIVSCLEQQTFQDFEVFLIIDKLFTDETFSQFTEEIKNFTSKIYDRIHVLTNSNSSFNPQKSEWWSYVRNFGIQIADAEFMQLFDDDVVFDKHFLEESFSIRQTVRKKIKKDFVLTPTLMYRKTGIIQNQWFKKYNFLLSRPSINFLWNSKSSEIQMYSWNALLAPSYIFKQTLFDEQIAWISEDLDFTYRIHKAGYPLYVFRDIKVYHMERDKTYLEQARVGNEECAYQKSRNRILFVKKHGNLYQKIVFYGFSLRWNSAWLLAKIWIYAPWKKKISLTWAFIKWIRDGFKSKVNK